MVRVHGDRKLFVCLCQSLQQVVALSMELYRNLGVFKGMMPPSATHFQAETTAAMAERGCAIRNLLLHCSTMPSVSSTHIFTDTEATQTVLTMEL